MLAIRLQRKGRKGYPVYRVIVQEAQRHPSSGRIVAQVGTYNPHTKEYKLDKEKIETYMENGAQPTPRVVKLLQLEKVNLPKWIEQVKTDRAGKTRNPDKLRKNQPKEAAADVAETAMETPAEEAKSEEPVTEETPAEDAKTEEPAAEKTE